MLRGVTKNLHLLKKVVKFPKFSLGPSVDNVFTTLEIVSLYFKVTVAINENNKLSCHYIQNKSTDEQK